MYCSASAMDWMRSSCLIDVTACSLARGWRGESTPFSPSPRRRGGVPAAGRPDLTLAPRPAPRRCGVLAYMNAETAFQTHRPRLMALAYRLLGSRADAEDVVQDAWLRWSGADPTGVRDAEAWLVTTTTRLGLDRLRAAKRERAHY